MTTPASSRADNESLAESRSSAQPTGIRSHEDARVPMAAHPAAGTAPANLPGGRATRGTLSGPFPPYPSVGGNSAACAGRVERADVWTRLILGRPGRAMKARDRFHPSDSHVGALDRADDPAPLGGEPANHSAHRAEGCSFFFRAGEGRGCSGILGRGPRCEVIGEALASVDGSVRRPYSLTTASGTADPTAPDEARGIR
jgi:hypothetical protein